MVVITHWEEVPWAGEEARRFWICEGVALLFLGTSRMIIEKVFQRIHDEMTERSRASD